MSRRELILLVAPGDLGVPAAAAMPAAVVGQTRARAAPRQASTGSQLCSPTSRRGRARGLTVSEGSLPPGSYRVIRASIRCVPRFAREEASPRPPRRASVGLPIFGRAIKLVLVREERRPARLDTPTFA